jgi:pyridoxal 5'-phosphate synthase pdxT subunit
MVKQLRIGVLALQGNVREHAAMLRSLGAEAVEVRRPDQLEGLDGLVVPGGESTAIGRLVRLAGLEEPLRSFDGALLGTCAGMILLARHAVDGRPDQLQLGLADVVARRNAFGRQVSSFEADLELADERTPLHGVFIRAPWIERAGEGVDVLAQHAGHPVAAREGSVLVTAFHPELTDDRRLHRRFADMVCAAREVAA